MYSAVFFDLDGTLTRSDKGIIESVVYALEKMGIRENNRDTLMKFIGPSLYDSFTKLYGLSDGDARRAIGFYREVYEKAGIYKSPPYEGVKEMLRKLNEKGIKCFVVTSKPEPMAERVVRYHELDRYLEKVIGPERQGISSDKSVLIRRALEELPEGERNSAVMVGDRKYDIEGSKKAGTASIGVLYGYGKKEELTDAGADYLAESPEDICRIVTEEEDNGISVGK